MKKKLIIVGKLPPPYMGPAIATQILINSKLKNKFDLIHFDNTINKSIETQGKFRLTKIFDVFKLYWNFYKLLASTSADITLIPISQTTTGFIKDAPFLWMAKKWSNKLVIQLRGSNLKTWLNGSSWLINFIFRSTMKGIDGVIVLGQKLRFLFSDYFNDDQIFVIPNGGDYSFPLKSNSDEKLNILYLANIYRSKGAEVVLDALQKIKHLNFKFLFVGGWRNDIDFKNRFLDKVNNLEGEVIISKPRSGIEKWQTFSNADIFVFPPIMPEGHPWVLVEAMAASLPIISTDQGAITESVINDKNGFIIEPNNSEILATKIELLIKDEKLRIQMGLKSRELYKANFTLNKMISKYIKVFDAILND